MEYKYEMRNTAYLTDPVAYDIMLRKMTRDMKFMGYYSFIVGILTSLSIIGAIIGVPMIIAGIRLREASEMFLLYHQSNDRSFLLEAFEKQRRYFFIQKILILVGILFLILYIIFIIFAFSSGLFRDFRSFSE